MNDASGIVEAIRAFLTAWDADREYQKNDLSEDVWAAVARLRAAIEPTTSRQP